MDRGLKIFARRAEIAKNFRKCPKNIQPLNSTTAVSANSKKFSLSIGEK